jgi:FAD/FMN-containing dehydrogenase/Fe-S oxidoreductase
MTSLPVLPPPDRKENPAVAAMAARLRPAFKGTIRCSMHDRALWSTDASLYQVTPLAVLEPETAEDFRAAIASCAAESLPVLMRGGGTSLAGQTVNTAVVIDTSRYLNQIISLDAGGRRCIVEPGVVLDHLNDAAGVHGLRFGAEVSTSTHATIGGMIGNCSAGLHSIIWGMTDRHVHAVDAILPDGTPVHLGRDAGGSSERVQRLTQAVVEIVGSVQQAIDDRFPRVARNVGGYKLDRILEQMRRSTPGTCDQVNLATLICGSEGTLAAVTAAHLDLVELPRVTGLSVVGFKTVDEAVSLVPSILTTDPAAVELIDETCTTEASRHPMFGKDIALFPTDDGKPLPVVLYVEHYGGTDEAVQERIEQLADVIGAAPRISTTDRAIITRLWTLRKVGLSLISGVEGDRKPIPGVEDCAVDPSRLPAFRRAFDEMLHRHGTSAVYYAHASVGLLHARPFLDLRNVEDRRTMESITREAAALVQEYDGSFSGEHGDGRARGEVLASVLGPELMDAFRRIREVFDPSGRFNPGDITDPPPMMADLRIDAEHAGPEVETFFDWSAEGGLGGAAAKCNGNGLCRRTSKGVMCPSYRATMDERHSTRGRGNALRLAITGQLPVADIFDDPETIETLDLCLSCKACRYECPSQVDLSKLKAEYTAQRYRQKGRTPWRTRMLAATRRINAIGAATAPWSNWVMRCPPVPQLVAAILGLDRRRTLPPFSKSLFRRHLPQAHSQAPTVILLADCFTAFNESDLGVAAITVLEACGYRVVVPDPGCCGRSAISTGVLDQAIRTIERTASNLLQVIEQESPVAIVGVEPSCVTAVQQEWVELKTSLDGDAMRQMASMTTTLEVFLADHWSSHPRRLSITHARTPILIHQHCHQKPHGQKLVTLLGHLGAEDVELLDSGCCGMAGSFGYQRDQYDLSCQIAELSLGDAMRDIGDATLLAPGTSCRHQVRDVFGVAAVHPVKWLADQLVR